MVAGARSPEPGSGEAEGPIHNPLKTNTLHYRARPPNPNLAADWRKYGLGSRSPGALATLEAMNYERLSLPK